METIGRVLFFLQLGGVLLACDGAYAEATGIYICITAIIAIGAAITAGWTGYLEGYRAGQKDNANV